ncbi:MAG: rod shape-determining protein, partial [Clostridia bacterium]|nr:rod shape-determining protein [Clostridia bacterium]
MGLGIDIGTSQVVIATSDKDVVLREPSVLAVEKASGKI